MRRSDVKLIVVTTGRVTALIAAELLDQVSRRLKR